MYLRALLFCAVMFASPAHAYSISIDYLATIFSDSGTDIVRNGGFGMLPIPGLGAPGTTYGSTFHVYQDFSSTPQRFYNGDQVFTSTARLQFGSNFYTIGPSDAHYLAPNNNSIFTGTGTLGDSTLLFAGSSGIFLVTDDTSSNFRYLRFTTSSLNVSSPGVSAVPLPESLPMFALGLLLLGIFGYARRRNSIHLLQQRNDPSDIVV